MAVFNTAEQGAVFSDARLDVVASLLAFREALLIENITPNITGAYDDHTVSGVAQPYATVGLVRSEFINEGAGNLTYDMRTHVQIQVFLHFAEGIAIYDERLKWDLLNSLFNYYKNMHRISANFDGLMIQSMEGDVAFTETQTTGSVFNFQLWRVVTP